MSLADELLADLEEIGDEADSDEEAQVHVSYWCLTVYQNYPHGRSRTLWGVLPYTEHN